MAKKSSKEIHDTLFKRRGSGGGFRSEVVTSGESFQFMTPTLERKAIKLELKYGSKMTYEKLDFYTDQNPFSRYEQKMERFKEQGETPDEKLFIQLGYSTSSSAIAEVDSLLKSSYQSMRREYKRLEKQGNAPSSLSEFISETRQTHPHFYLGGLSEKEKQDLISVTGSSDILGHLTIGSYTKTVERIQETLMTGKLKGDSLKVKEAESAFEGLNKIIKNIETSGYKRITERYVEVESVEDYDYEDRVIEFKDLPKKTRETLRKMLNDKIKVRGGTRQLTEKEIDTILENVSDFQGFVKEYEITSPNEIFGEQQPPKEFINIIDLMGETTLLEDLKLPIGGDVLAWFEDAYAGGIRREDIENMVQDEYTKKRALELYDKEGLNKDQIAYLNRITRGLVGAVKPPSFESLEDALRKGLRRQLPRVGVRVENWFKNAKQEFQGSELLPVLYDLADRVANAKGYKALFEPGTEINLWYHNYGPDDERILEIIRSLEESSGLRADWGLTATDDDNNPLNGNIMMIYQYFIDKYSDVKSFPDTIYDYFVEQGVIQDDRKK